MAVMIGIDRTSARIPRSRSTAPLCRIHDHLACLAPGGANKHLTADKAAALLRRIRPTDPVGTRRRLIVRELITELPATDRKIAPLDADIAWMLDEHAATLTDIVGTKAPPAAAVEFLEAPPTSTCRSILRSQTERSTRPGSSEPYAATTHHAS